MAAIGDYIDFPLRIKTADLLNLQRDINTHHLVHNQIFQSLNHFLTTGILSNGKVPTIGNAGVHNGVVGANGVVDANPVASANAVGVNGDGVAAAINAISVIGVGAAALETVLGAAALETVLGAATAAMGGAAAAEMLEPPQAAAALPAIRADNLHDAAAAIANMGCIAHSDARPLLLALGWNNSPIMGAAAIGAYNAIGFPDGAPLLYGGRRTRRRRNKKTNNRGRRPHK